MIITREMLRNIIREAVFEFPSTRRIEDMLKDTYNDMISQWDDGDPSMTHIGMSGWIEQVDNAIEFIRDNVDNDLSMYESIENEAYDMLHDGRFWPENPMFMMRMKF